MKPNLNEAKTKRIEKDIDNEKWIKKFNKFRIRNKLLLLEEEENKINGLIESLN